MEEFVGHEQKESSVLLLAAVDGWWGLIYIIIIEENTRLDKQHAAIMEIEDCSLSDDYT